MTNIDPAKLLLSNLGSFWTEVFSNDNETLDYVRGTNSMNDQTLLDAANAIATVSRFEIPIFRHRYWNRIVIANSQLVLTNKVFYSLGEAGLALGDDELVLGKQKTADVWLVDLPANVSVIANIVDRPVSPTVVLTKGIDFDVDLTTRQIVFYKDPSTLGFAISSIDVDGSPEPGVTFWLFNSEEDLKYVYNQFGFVVSLYAQQSTENYKALINAAFDNLIRSSNILSLRTALASLCGMRTVQRQTETVELINVEHGRLQIITDYDVYDFEPNAQPSVAVGDVVHAGDIMVDSIQFYENEEAANAPITALALDPELFNLSLSGNIIFSNQTLDTTYSTDSSGFAILQFPIGGEAADITKFWNNATVVGKATGNSVAQAVRLDSNTGQPNANQVPSTINPMQFLINHVLKANLTLVVLKVSEVSFISGFGSLVLLRRFIPPHVALFLCNEINAEIDYNEAIVEPGNQMLAIVNSVLSDNYSYGISETVDLIRIGE